MKILRIIGDHALAEKRDGSQVYLPVKREEEPSHDPMTHRLKRVVSVSRESAVVSFAAEELSPAEKAAAALEAKRGPLISKLEGGDTLSAAEQADALLLSLKNGLP